MAFKVPSGNSKPAANSRPAAGGKTGAPAGGRPAVFKSFSMNLKDTQSLNDGAFRDLPEGRWVYTVLGFTQEAVKSDPTGKKYKLSLSLNRRLPDDKEDKYTHNFNVCADSEQAREIAFKGVKALAEACGISSETFNAAQFPALKEKDIVLEVKASTKVDPVTRKPVTRLNLNRIDAPTEEDYQYLIPEGDGSTETEGEGQGETEGEGQAEGEGDNTGDGSGDGAGEGESEGTGDGEGDGSGEGEGEGDGSGEGEGDGAGDADAGAETAAAEAPAPTPPAKTTPAAPKTGGAPASGKRQMPWEKNKK